MVFVVVSVWHGYNAQGIWRDRTFLHGVFDDLAAAQRVQADVDADRRYILEEGYEIQPDDRVSTYISSLPLNIRVNDFVATWV